MLFKRTMTDGKGKTYNQGQRVPDGFSTPAGLEEMIKAGDIVNDEPQVKQKTETVIKDVDQGVETGALKKAFNKLKKAGK